MHNAHVYYVHSFAFHPQHFLYHDFVDFDLWYNILNIGNLFYRRAHWYEKILVYILNSMFEKRAISDWKIFWYHKSICRVCVCVHTCCGHISMNKRWLQILPHKCESLFGQTNNNLYLFLSLLRGTGGVQPLNVYQHFKRNILLPIYVCVSISLAPTQLHTCNIEYNKKYIP